MSKNQFILVMGVFLIIMPNLGFSIFWESWILRVLGTILIIIFLHTYIKNNKSSKNDEEFIREEINEVYVESYPENKNQTEIFEKDEAVEDLDGSNEEGKL